MMCILGPLLVGLPASAVDAITVQTASTHPMRYLLSVPAGYEPGRGESWPVLICIYGAGSYVEEMAQTYVEARGQRPCFIVVPCTFSSTNAIAGEERQRFRRYYSDELIDSVRTPADPRGLDWDEQGLLAILDDLQRQYGTEPRVYITGFSGGGLLLYRMLFRHPERLVGVAAVAANLLDADQYRDRTKPAADRSFPVRLIIGTEDPFRRGVILVGRFNRWQAGLLGGLAGLALGGIAWRSSRRLPLAVMSALTMAIGLALLFWPGVIHADIDGQMDVAVRLLKDLGYSNVQVEVVPDMGHVPAAELVIAAFEPYWNSKR